MAVEYVRVRMENGSHKTIRADHAERLGLKPLKQDGLGRDGRPRPPVHRADLGTASAATTRSSTASSASSDESQED